MQLSGSLPDCLFATPGTLSQVDFANNNLTGAIPDVIPANSSLFGVVLASNNLTGTIPGSLRNASMLSNLELNNNQLQGSLPADFAAGMSMLEAVQLSSNTLTGQCLAQPEISSSSCGRPLLCAVLRCAALCCTVLHCAARLLSSVTTKLHPLCTRHV